MDTVFINIFFSLLSLFIFTKSYLYGLYEIRNESNLSGGVTVIAFSFICIVFTNILVWLH